MASEATGNNLDNRMIRDAVVVCRQSLKKCLDISRLMIDDWAEKRLIDFDLWAAGAGVSAGGILSLDTRLAPKPDIKNGLINLINLLKVFIESCQEKAQHKNENALSDHQKEAKKGNPHRDLEFDVDEALPNDKLSPDEVQAKTDVEVMMNQIIRLTVAIRKAGSDARLRRADKSYDPENDEIQDLKSLLELVMHPKGPKKIEVLSTIQSRLIDANLRRRHRFTYAKAHSQKLAVHGVDMQPKPVTKKVSNEEDLQIKITTRSNPEVRDLDDGAVKEDSSDSPAIQAPPSATAASAIEVPVVINEEKPSKVAPTVISRVTSKITYPRPPPVPPGSQVFKCPCCCQSLPISLTERSRWKKHLANDILPYTCILPDCTRPLQLYLARKDWENHIKKEHGQSWNCLVCEQIGKIREFYEERRLVHHLQTEHKDDVDKDEIPMFVEASHNLKTVKSIECPLCAGPGPEENTIDHVAQCLHDFSLWSLPLQHEEDRPEDYFDIDSENSNAQITISRSSNEYKEHSRSSRIGDGSAASDGFATSGDHEDSDDSNEADHSDGNPLTESILRSWPQSSTSKSGDQVSDWISGLNSREARESIEQPRSPPPIRRPVLTREDYTIGWTCVLPMEVEIATAMLDVRHLDFQMLETDSIEYRLGSIGRHNIVIASPQSSHEAHAHGLAFSSAAIIERMIKSFENIRFHLLLGIGSGIPPKVRLGDVVVGTPTAGYPGVICFDSGKSPQSSSETGQMSTPPHFILKVLSYLQTGNAVFGSKIPYYVGDVLGRYPGLKGQYSRPDSIDEPSLGLAMVDRYRRERERAGPEDRNRLGRNDRETAVHFGLIASGNQIIRSASFRDRLNNELEDNLLCIEAGAAGVPQQLPCLVIRGICDYADEHKTNDWQHYAALTSAAFAKEFLGCVGHDGTAESSLPIGTEDSIDVNTPLDLDVVDTTRLWQLEILEWLSGRSFGPVQNDLLSKKQSNTDEEMKNLVQFKEWFSNQERTLFCIGAAGTGKSILMSSIVDWLLTERGTDSNNHIGVGYVYLGNGFRCTAEDVFANLLKQLGHNSPFPAELQALYGKHKEHNTQPTVEEYLQALSSITSRYSKIFILVDALDELDPEQRDVLLSDIFAFQSTSRANLFLTSREIPGIRKDFAKSLTSNVSTGNEAFNLQVEGMLTSISTSSSPTCTSIGENRDLLILPSTLSQLYAQVITRIQWQRNNETAFFLLGLALYALVPLKISEIQHAFAVDVGKRGLDKRRILPIGYLLLFYSDFVIITGVEQAVHIVHESVRELIMTEHHHLFPNIASKIAEICIAYLSLEIFEDEGACPDPESLETRLASYPFYRHAATHWGYYVRKAGIETTPSVLYILQNKPLVLACSQIILDSLVVFTPTYSKAWNWMHLAAFFGLEYAIKALGPDMNQLESKDMYGKTPLFWATENGHEATVKALIDYSVDLNTKCEKGQTPLFLAVDGKLPAIATMLLAAGADPNSEDLEAETPIYLAIEKDYYQLVEILIERGASLNRGDRIGQSPLFRAVEHSDQPVTRLLIKNGADVNWLNKHGETPIYIAVRNIDEAMTKFLINKGAQMNCRDISGRTPLYHAVVTGNVTLVKLLMETGAVVDLKDHSNTTPLQTAVKSGFEDITRLLINEGADINARDHLNRSPIFWAVEKGDEKMTTTLLELGADVKCVNITRQSPLHLAVANGNETLARLLIQHGAIVDVQDLKGQSPLDLAKQNGNEALFKLLAGDSNIALKGEAYDTWECHGCHNIYRRDLYAFCTRGDLDGCCGHRTDGCNLCLKFKSDPHQSGFKNI